MCCSNAVPGGLQTTGFVMQLGDRISLRGPRP